MIDGVKVTINGIARASGMIAPDMATIAASSSPTQLAGKRAAGMPQAGVGHRFIPHVDSDTPQATR